jgi:hypothetical protein
MSIPQYAPKQTYTGTGSLANYTFDFNIFALTQLLVIEVNAAGVETQRVRGTDTTYLSSVTFDAVNGGGTVVLAANLPAGYNLILLEANDAPTQDYRFRDKNSFSVKRFEDALDAILAAVQRLVYRANQSFKIHDLDDETTFNTQLPPGIADNAGRVFQVNQDGDAFEYGPTTNEIANAQGYAIDAANSAQDAANSADNAEDSKEIAEDAANEAQYLLFDGNTTINDTMSPVALTEAAYGNKIITVNAENGNVIINLDPIASYTEFFKVQFVRSDDTPNIVTIVPNGAETIDGDPTYVLGKGLAVILSIKNPTEWQKKFIGMTNGGSALPEGGVEFDYLEKGPTDAAWVSGVFSGFSARYGQLVNLEGISEALRWIFDFSYQAPIVSLAASGSGTIREKGAAVTSSNLNANVTKRTEDIARIQFFFNGGAIPGADFNPPASSGSQAQPYAWAGSFTDNATFRADVTDTPTGTTVSSSANFTFVYPYYYGCRAPGATPAQVAGLTKDIINSTATLVRNFNVLTNGDVFYFAYPASYGALTSILDQNGFETFASWTLTTANITGLDGNAVSYRIYEFEIPQAVGASSFTFKR